MKYGPGLSELSAKGEGRLRVRQKRSSGQEDGIGLQFQTEATVVGKSKTSELETTLKGTHLPFACLSF